MFVGNPFEVLGVSPDAPSSDIKKAYRKLCAKYHPDVGGDADMFDKITKAYDAIQSGAFIKEVKRSRLTHVGLFSYAKV